MPQISIIKKSNIQEARRFDAEFFKPEYLEIERKIINHQWDYLRDISEDILTGKTPQYEKDAKTLVVRSGDLRKNLIDIDGLLKTNETDLFYLNKNDVLISSIGKGSIGKIAINYEKEKIVTVSEVTVIRNAKITSAFLNMFLLSYFGQAQIEKFITGATGQLHLLPSNIKKFKIPILPQSFQLQIEKIVKYAYQKQTKSKQLYKEAEKTLLKELDLLDYKPKHILSFQTTKKETDEARRFDAEYFQPKYDEIIKKIEKYKNGWNYVKNIVHWKKGVEVGSETYRQSGMSFGRVSDFSINGVEKTGKKISKELYQELKKDYQPKQNDILFTKDGTIGLSYVIKEEFEVILSGAFLRLSLKDKYQSFEKECLSLIFNSIICKMQVEKLSGGAIIAHLKPSDFEKFKIPLIKPQIQKQIAKKIQESHKLRKKSKELLEEAKRRVEEKIEMVENN
ncbi:MAG: restriction endonuclease subunit S [Candidatus Andersenbacteria bacterium]|nr:restriction endonuclease subunit S [Candidatus Andersenbacteria bacterium]